MYTARTRSIHFLTKHVKVDDKHNTQAHTTYAAQYKQVTTETFNVSTSRLRPYAERTLS